MDVFITALQSVWADSGYSALTGGNLIMMAGHITIHARQLIIGLGKSNVWRHIFSDICQKYAVTNA